MQLDLTLLRTFVAVAESGGFTRAGERLNMTQSAVSVHIRKLEEQTGRRLLERNSRQVSLTEDGTLLLSGARRMLALHDEIEDRFSQREVEGVVRLGVHDYAASSWLPPLLKSFHRRHPRVRLEVRTGLSLQLREAFAHHELDIAIHSPVEPGDGVTLWRERRAWVGAEDFDLAEDRPVPLALHPMPCLMRQAAVEALDRVGRPWRVVFTGHSGASIRAAALAGLALTVIPARDLSPGLKVLGGADGLPPVPDLQFALFRRESDDAPAVHHLAEMLLSTSLELAAAA